MKPDLDILIAGGGPAASGALISAFLSGRASELGGSRVRIVDASGRLALGGLGGYAIRSNSYATSFIECAEDDGAPAWLRGLQASGSYRWLARHRSTVVPLPIVARFQRRLGEALYRAVDDLPGVSVSLGQSVTGLTRSPDGWRATVVGSAGREQVTARKALIATGGRARGLPGGWPAAVPAARLFGPAPGLQLGRFRRAVILGGSHSAWAAAWKLLRHGDPRLEVTLLCRRQAKAYFDSEAAAIADGYLGFDPAADVCPLTLRLYRLGGLRGDARHLFLQGHPRLQVRQGGDFLQGQAPEAVLAADLVVEALGYVPNCPPLFDAAGAPIAIARPRAVDEDCRLLGADGAPLPGVYAVGLGFGYRLPAEMGGEPGFNGQTNGLWLYQHDVGQRVVAGLLDTP